MSKTISSPVERWPGSVTLADPLTLAQARAIEEAFRPELPAEVAKAEEKYQAALDEFGAGDPKTIALEDRYEKVKRTARVFLSVADARQLSAIIACAEKWELENFPDQIAMENFPASPRKDSHRLVDWLFRELLAIYFGESEVPNG